MKTYPLSKIMDHFIDKIGTPKRDKFESKLNKELEKRKKMKNELLNTH
jgi:hypothetical protein